MKVHDARDGFHDLKPDILVGVEAPWLWIVVGLLLIILAWRYLPRREKKVRTEIKRVGEYLQELISLEAKAKVSTTPKIYTSEASLVIRRYILDRIGLPVLECTPLEVESIVLKSGKLATEVVKEIGKLLLQLENISFSEERTGDSKQAKAVQLICQCRELIETIEHTISQVVK